MKPRIRKDNSIVRRLRPSLLAWSVAACFAGTPAWALPTGAQVAAGAASFNQVGNSLTIANTPGAIINWNAFSIGALEAVRFDQQNSLSAVLNRVTGGSASAIHGALSSNGRVFLINPNGILFGAGSRIDVNGLIASTLNLSDQDFLAGKLNFQAGATAGALRNAGSLQASPGGNIYLIAPDIENSGIVRAPNGEVLLAAGRQVSLVDGAHPDIQVVVSAPTDKAVNLGAIAAGKVSVFGALLAQRGTVSADTVETDAAGRIVFRASKQLDVEAGSRTTANGAAGGTVVLQSAGDTYVRGAVEATGSAGQGGTIVALGERVAVLDQAVLDASGETGGGRIMVGGDYQGRNPAVQNAQVTYFGPDATLRADARKVGAGGTVIVWADDTTRAHGHISARGGNEGGDGGFVETSGKQGLDVHAHVDTRAPNGQPGVWLLDPSNITVQSGGSAALTDVDVFGDNTCADCTVDPGSINSSGATVVLQANNNITFTDPISMTNAGIGLTAQAGNNILVNGAITTKGGAISLTANDSGGIETNTGSITINAALDTTNATPTGANITLTTPGSDPTSTPAIAINASLNSGSAGDIYLTAASATKGITQSAGSITGDILTISAAGPISLNQLNNQFNSLAANLTGGTASTLTLNKSIAGPLSITNLNSTGAVTIDMAGALTQTNPITAPSLDITTAGRIYLPMANTVSEVTLYQSSATGAEIQFNASGGLTLNSIANNTTTVSLGDVFIEANGPIVVNGNISTADTDPGAIVALNTQTSSSITRTAGTITGNTIQLQTITSSTGAIGASGSPILTSSIGGSGTATITLGNNPNATVLAAYLSHTGDINLSSTSGFATNAPINISATGNFTIPAMAINSGISDLVLSAGGRLSLASGGAMGTSLSGANISLTANRLNIDTTDAYDATINAGSGLVWLRPVTGGWNIDLGSSTDVAANTLELSTNELNQITAGTLRIGDTTAGALNISAAIAPSYTSTLNLKAGGNITQGGAGTLSVANLALQSLGDVFLDTLTNNITNLAASLGDGSHPNRNIRFKNSPTLNVGSGVDGLTGITINLDASGFDYQNPNGVIALTSANGVTQSPGAYLSGKAVYAEGMRVNLGLSNPTGVIAGKATGTGTGDTFIYQSTNGINLSTVNGFSGITTGSPSESTSAYLTAGAAGISQLASAPIVAGGGSKGLMLETTGPVNLTSNSNNVGAVATGGTNPSSFDFYDLSGLTIGIGGNGIATSGNGNININTTGPLTVQGELAAGTGQIGLEGQNITLGTTGAAGTTVSGGLVKFRANTPSTGTITSNTTSANTITGSAIVLEADNFSFTSTQPSFSATNTVHFAGVSDDGNLTTSGFADATFGSTPWLVIGKEVASDTNTTGNLSIDTAINRSGFGVVLLAGGGISQTAPITATNLAFMAGTVSPSSTIVLDSSNSVSNLAGQTQGGDISFTNGTALNVSTIGDGTHTATGLASNNGAITLTISNTSSNVAINNLIDAGTGAVTITSSSGAILDGNNGSLNIKANSASLTAYGGIGILADAIETQVSSLTVQKSPGMVSGDIAIANTGALATSISGNNNSHVSLTNVGSITTTGSGITAGGGTTSVTASGIASDITVATSSTIGGTSISLSAGRDVSVNGGTIQAGGSGGDVTINVGNNISVSNAGQILANDAVYLNLAGANSLVSLATGGQIISNQSGIPNQATTYINFASRTAGPGLQIEGSPYVGGDAGISGTGIYHGESPVASSVEAGGLVITYASPPSPPPPPPPPPPTVDECTTNPSLPGCTAVLPPLATCTTAPTTPGCSAVLPTVDACVTNPTAPGCTVVLPPLATCTTAPTTPGCSAVLPTIDACIANPAAAGCSAVLPTIDACVTNPAAPGCSTVLPTLNACVANPGAPGCSVVLPTVSACVTNPSAPGCSAVLPTINACVSNPSAPGCSVVLPTLDACVTNPTAVGCSAVLPTINACVSNPSAPGCAVVLPTLDACVANPTAAGCGAVLPSLDACVTNPGAIGCGVVLPPLATCTAAPSTPGCLAVLPPPTLPTNQQLACLTNPAACVPGGPQNSGAAQPIIQQVQSSEQQLVLNSQTGQSSSGRPDLTLGSGGGGGGGSSGTPGSPSGTGQSSSGEGEGEGEQTGQNTPNNQQGANNAPPQRRFCN